MSRKSDSESVLPPPVKTLLESKDKIILELGDPLAYLCY